MNTQNTNHLRSESHSHDQEPPPILRILREGIVRVVQEEAERLNPEPAQAISRWLDSGDPDAAERFLLRLAEDGDPAIQWCMGMACAAGLGAEKDWPRAIDWFRRSAEQGYAEAQTRMGLCYYLGNDTSEQDCPLCLEWFRMAADEEADYAYYRLDAGSHAGQSVDRNWPLAAHWFRRAADQGSGSGCLWLGHCYEQGLGVKEDPSQAVQWFRKGAELGSITAREQLSNCYFWGHGVEPDIALAMKLST